MASILGQIAIYLDGKKASNRDSVSIDVLAKGVDASLTYEIYDEIYVREPDKGLMKLVGDTLELIPGGERFADQRIHAILPLNDLSPNGDKRMLIATSLAGLFEYDGHTISPFPCSLELTKFLETYPIYAGTKLSNGDMAFACLQGGMIIIGQDGKMKKNITQADGLRDGIVTHVYEDKNKGLWLTLFDGISYVEAQSPLSVFTDEHGLDMDLWELALYNDRLYMTGSKGLYFLSPGPGFQPPSIQKVPEINGVTWGTQITEDYLWVASAIGTFHITDQEVQKYNNQSGASFCRSTFDPSLLYLSTPLGVTILKKEANEWINLGKVKGLKEEVQNIQEVAKGVLWGGLSEGFVRIILPDSLLARLSTENQQGKKPIPLEAQVKQYTEKWLGQGHVYVIAGKPFLASNIGLKSYDSAKDKVVPDSSFSSKYIQGKRQISYMYEDYLKRVWIVSHLYTLKEIDLWIPTEDGGYKQAPTPFHRLQDFEEIWSIHVNEANPDIAWLAGNNGLIRYDLNIASITTPLFKPAIRKVIANGDSLIYLGTNLEKGKFELPFSQNALRFEFALPAYNDPSKTTYQVMLEGMEEKWSSWTDESQKDYTNLKEGNYRFRVKAQTIYREVSDEGVFEFAILAPWYRTWWAYLLYGLLAVGAVFALIQWRTRQLKAKTEELEAIVHARTHEVRAQKDQLEVQAERLQELDREKSRFFTNISHEFRTPLTVILGMVDTISGYERARTLIKRNSRNLLELINQILDLRKLESGKLQVEYIQGNIIQYLNYIAESFSSLADIKLVQLSFDTKVAALYMDYDIEKTLRIVSNLLSNAIKFTPKGGEVKVVVRILEAPKMESLNSQGLDLKDRLIIKVIDSGKGISADKLPYIFDQFYQADNSSIREGEGTGIGLTLTHELVKLLNGAITVDSEPGKGTTFVVQLPIQRMAPLTEDFKTPAVQEPPLPKVANGTDIPTPQAIKKTVREDQPKVLIVEDNADVVEYLLTCLDSEYDVVIAKDGQEGIETALEEIPDLIITDVMMPRKNGFELCQTLKIDERTSHIPIIILTAKTDADSRISGFERGADAYLAKPFNKDELLVRIRKLIELRKLLQARYTSTSNPAPSEDLSIQQEDAFILRLKEVLESRLSDEAFRVPELCKAMGMSRSQMHRKVTALTGRSITKYVRLLRLLKAKEFLQDPTLTLAEIGYMVGFNSPSYFTRCYVEEFGVAPSEERA